MTIAATITSKQYTGNGATSQFAFPNKIFAAGDLAVTIIDNLGNQYPFVNFANATLGLTYAVQGVDVDTGCTVVLSAALTNNWTIDIRSLIPDTQSTSIKNQGSFFPELHEEAFDRATRMIQDLLRLTYLYGIHGPDIETAPWPALPIASARKGQALMFDALTGLPTLGVPNTQTITTGLLAPFLGLGITVLETLRGVTPVNYAYLPGDYRRYGALGDGVADDSTAIANAVLTGHRMLGGGPEFTYLLNSQILLGLFTDIDLQGATLKPSGNHLNLNSIVTPTATTTYSGAIASGQRVFVVSSATGIAMGQWVQFVVSQATEETSAYPPSWAQVTNVAGTTITVDRAFQVDYPNAPTTATVNFYNDVLLGSKCHIKNGIIDGSASTYSGGSIGIAIRAAGYKDVALENLRLIGWNTTLGDDLVVCTQYIKARVSRVYVQNCTCGSQMINLVDGMDGAISDCTFDGSAFGTSITRADEAEVINCTAIGRRRQEFDNSVTERSVRGFKFYGCKYARCEGNHATDYESPIRFQGVWRGIINGNVVVNADMGTAYSGSIALNVGNQINGTITEQIIISNNIVENGGGVGIGVSSSTSYGKYIITDNQVRNTQGHGIYCNCKNSIISNNQVYNWGLRNSGDNAIYHDSGATVIGNRFYHDTLTTLGCIREVFTSTYKYTFRDNISPTNPLFVSTKDVVGFGGTTIASGTTSQTPSHNLIITPPDITWFKITPGNNPTNDPGWFWVDTLTATTFKLNVRSDPGAGGAVFGWRAEVPMPFTAP